MTLSSLVMKVETTSVSGPELPTEIMVDSDAASRVADQKRSSTSKLKPNSQVPIRTSLKVMPHGGVVAAAPARVELKQRTMVYGAVEALTYIIAFTQPPAVRACWTL